VESVKKHPKTNLFVIDENLWKWAKYRASILGYRSVSEYIFDLIRKDRESIEKSRGA